MGFRVLLLGVETLASTLDDPFHLGALSFISPLLCMHDDPFHDPQSQINQRLSMSLKTFSMSP